MRVPQRLYTYCTFPLVAAAIVLASAVTSRAAEEVNFNRDIRPLLANKCFRCHGPDAATREAGLRLDVRAAAIAELESGDFAIAPGKPADSTLLDRVVGGSGERMPPEEAGEGLTAAEVSTLRKWIEQGAVYQPHWSLKPPVKSQPPQQLKHESSVKNAIDRFVLRRLEDRQLSPSPAASRHVLIRRLSLDITGLPPTVEEVDAFAQDTQPGAYQRAVDRLLGSSAYGERWARVWLDLARYADSAGYAQDPLRTIWRYRDWVISSLNNNMPFNQFTIEQIAGDMIPDATDNQLIATAFHRNTMTNSEGGTSDEEFRNAAVVDRVNTTMQVWMGVTAGCAQCHDHKYDPLSQEEYFSLFAIFNNTQDADRNDESPLHRTMTADQVEQRKALQQQIKQVEQKIAAEKKLAGAQPDNPPATAPPESGTALPVRYIRVELPGGNVFLSLAELQAFNAAGDNVAVKGKASQISTGFSGPAALAIDGNTSGDYAKDKSVSHTAGGANPWWEVALDQDYQLTKVAIWNRTDGVGNRLTNSRLILLDAARKPLFVQTIAAPPEPSTSVAIPATTAALTAAQQQAVKTYKPGQAPPASQSPLMQQLAKLKKQHDAIKGVPTPVMQELPAGRGRKTHVQLRGSYLQKGKEVKPGVPAAFHPLPAGAGADRLSLAKWLVDRRNPLTARVVVNRYWEQIFGIGLVETSEDFGNQGELPSHPELLDFLAVELMEHDWDVQWLIRTIVSSATYQQTSQSSAKLNRVDPRNRLLARGASYRLPAEMIRDQALFIGGLLSRKMYGPSVQPPRPVLGLRAAFGGSTDWKTSQGEDRYRRGLYTSWRRTTPYPSMTTFDAPSREVCTIRRIRTNTPLQALVTLNDPVFVEASQALAARMLTEVSGDAGARIKHGFRLCVARPPSAAELARLKGLLNRLKAAYGKDQQTAVKLATGPLMQLKQDKAELAAWAVLGNVLLNLDELLSKR